MRCLRTAFCLLAGTDRATLAFRPHHRGVHRTPARAAKRPVDRPSSAAPAPVVATGDFRELRRTWPLWLQQGVRDTGTLRFVVDFLTRVSVAPNFFVEHENSFPEFCRITGYPAWLATAINKTWTNVKEDDVDVGALPPIDFAVDKYGSRPEQFAEVMLERARNKDVQVPLVVFVHGGAWGSGFPGMYRLTALPFLARGYRVAVVGYRVYPQADVDGQMADVARALRHLAEAHGATATVVVGHSSGAHICVLASLRGMFPANVVGLVGMSGIYDIAQHYAYERIRGVDQISPMKPSCGTTAENMRNRSPKYVVNGLDKHTLRKSLPPLLLVHGADDDTALPIESIGMQEALEVNHFTQSELALLEGVAHADTVLQLSFGGKTQETILEWFDRLRTERES